MRNINKFKIKEFKEYTSLMNEYKEFGDVNFERVFQLFGLDISKMSVEEYTKSWNEINEMKLIDIGVKPFYFIGKNRYKADLNINSIKAGQFIDLQNIIKRDKNDLASILAVILIPQKKTWFWYKNRNYAQGYDVLEAIKEIENNMTIMEAHSLSNFFFSQSQQLLKVTKDYLTKKNLKMKKKLYKI
jgi:hypothetical protein